MKPHTHPLPSSSTPISHLIARCLRLGVTISFIFTLIGGIIYLIQHGSDPIPPYSTFISPAADTSISSLITLPSLLTASIHLSSKAWIQLGVLLLFLTPILRVLLSFFDFLKQRDWLYVLITTIVLTTIIFSAFDL